MSLTSRLLRGDAKLEQCLIRDSAHIVPGSVGEHVRKIQSALMLLDDAVIDARELAEKRYGPMTTAAVLSFKQQRRIINYSYQQQADNIVGKMTIATLDRELRGLGHGQYARDIQCQTSRTSRTLSGRVGSPEVLPTNGRRN